MRGWILALSTLMAKWQSIKKTIVVTSWGYQKVEHTQFCKYQLGTVQSTHKLSRIMHCIIGRAKNVSISAYICTNDQTPSQFVLEMCSRVSLQFYDVTSERSGIFKFSLDLLYQWYLSKLLGQTRLTLFSVALHKDKFTEFNLCFITF